MALSFEIENDVLVSCTYTSKKDIKNIIIPAGIVRIDKFFDYGKEIKTITLPQSLKTIGCGALSSTGISLIDIPEGVTNIEREAFCGNEKLKEIVIPNGVLKINDGVFIGCRKLVKVVIPNSVNSIGEFAFMNCIRLKNIELPNNLTFIGYRAFAYCGKLKNITIPDSVNAIGKEAFGACYNLKSITVSRNVTEIGENAFVHCKKLTMYAPAGSYAEQYAKENNIPFVLLNKI